MVLALALGGCAEETRIRTIPDAALVSVNGKRLGTSPVTLAVPSHSLRAGSYRYKVEKEGYITKEGDVPTHMAVGRLIGAIFTGGIVLIFHGVQTLPPETNVELTQGTMPTSTTSSVHPSADDAAQKLRHIQDLYDQGLINDQEYKRYRSDVLRGVVNGVETVVPK